MPTSKPIAILHVADKLTMDDAHPSSVAFLLADWIQYLEKGPFRLAVCAMRAADPGGAYLEARGVRVHYLGLGKYSPRNIGAIMALIEQEGADLVHLHGLSSSNFGRIASWRKGIPNVIHGHDTNRFKIQYVADLALRGITDAGIGVSECVRQEMIEYRHIPAACVSVIFNGVDFAKFRRPGSADSLLKKAELGLAPDTNVVGTITRFRPEKGNEYLIRAIPKILKECPGTVFLIVGTGPLEAPLRKLAQELGVSDAVRFLGFRTDIAELLAIFNVNVTASLAEPFGIPLVEAMWIGTPNVATFAGGIKELGRDNETVLYVQPRNPSEIAQKVCRLLKDHELARSIVENARRSCDQFDIKVSAERLGETYRRLHRS